MSRIERAYYECDWCGAHADADDRNLPPGWRFLDSFDIEDDMCPDCVGAAKTLLTGARALLQGEGSDG